jgi:hypothetical protein
MAKAPVSDRVIEEDLFIQYYDAQKSFADKSSARGCIARFSNRPEGPVSARRNSFASSLSPFSAHAAELAHAPGIFLSPHASAKARTGEADLVSRVRSYLLAGNPRSSCACMRQQHARTCTT